MARFFSIVLIFAVAANHADACWTAISATGFAEGCPIIIKGKIVAVAEARPGGDRLDDQAAIRIDAIEKNELKDVPLKVGGIFTVRMISRNNRSRSSTDLNYPLHTEAFWLIRLTTKGEFRIDLHPVQMLPLRHASDGKVGQGPRIESKEDVKGNPIGRYTVQQWIAKVKEEEAKAARHREKQRADEKKIRDIAKELALAPNLDASAFRRFRAANTDIRRDIFQLRDHDQPLEGDRLVAVVEIVLATDPNPSVRVFAGNALAYTKKPGRRTNEVLAAALSDRDADVRMFVCQALRIRDARDQAGVVALLLRDDSKQVREMAAHSLAHFLSSEWSLFPH